MAPHPQPPPCQSQTAPGDAWTTHLRSFDEDAMTLALQDGVLEHVQLAGGRFHGDIVHSDAEAAGGDTRIDWGAYNLPILARGDLPRDRLTISVALEGDGPWRGHGRPVRLGNIAILPEGGELDVVLPAQAQWLTLQVPRHRLDAAGLQLDRRPGGSFGRVAGRLGPASWQALHDLATVLAPRPAGALPGSATVAEAHAQLLDLLLCEIARRSDDAGVGNALAPGERWHLVRRVERYLQAQGDLAVRIDALCLAAGTSVSRLERAFREAFNVNPRRFLVLRRLALARRSLQQAGAATSVTGVATDSGFFHLGRFAREYRLLYGERPSDTLARAAGCRGGARRFAAKHIAALP